MDTAGDRVDTTTRDRYYSDVADALAQVLAVNATLVIVANDSTVVLPSDAVALIGVFWDGVWLYEEDLASLETEDKDWRDVEGTPHSYTQENENDDTFTLFPKPDTQGTITFLYTQRRLNLPAWLEFPMAFDILAREFNRDSDHRDTVQAGAFKQLGQYCYGMSI
jgi:hypothetical protein